MAKIISAELDLTYQHNFKNGKLKRIYLKMEKAR
jgi:hypothetical protein